MNKCYPNNYDHKLQNALKSSNYGYDLQCVKRKKNGRELETYAEGLAFNPRYMVERATNRRIMLNYHGFLQSYILL